MKILVFGKRFSSGKDCVLEDFGREIRLAEQLQLLGSKVVFFAADFHKKGKFNRRLHGMDVRVRPFTFFAFPFYLAEAVYAAFKVDVVIAMSDPLMAVVGFTASVLARKPLVYDIRDNYETYESIRLPGVRFFQRLALRRASAVTAVSGILAEKSRHQNVFVLGNGVNPALFRPLPKYASRKRLSLPRYGKIISYMGSARIPGIQDLVVAFKKLAKRDKNLFLLLIGNFEFTGERIIVRKPIPYEELPYAINAVDVLVIPYHKTPFTRIMYSTYKLSEFMACNRPIICTDVGEMKKLLDPKFVVQPGNALQLRRTILAALKFKKVNYRRTLFGKGLTWELLGRKMHSLISGVIHDA